MTYCTVNKVRLVSGLTSEKVSDSTIRDLRDGVATSKFNSDVNQKVEDERVDLQVSGEKENAIDGSNKVFYLHGPHKSELQVGDRDNDGVVDADDIIIYQIDGDDNRVSDLNVVLKDREIGKLEVELSNGDALEEGRLFATYSLSPVDQNGYGTDFSGEGPDRLVETACAQLTAAYAFTNIEADKLQNFDVGNVKIKEQSEGKSIMMNDYRETLKRINQSQVVQSGPNENSVGGVFKGV